ncbi:MAG TPA: peptidase C39 family protein, partial [Microbacteriaceae bacterium]|nr:peptidase C39 family protein [Microbacteriaceae bacterium]
RAAIWNVERDLWRPRTIAVQSDWGEAVALTSARPHTSYRKIVDVVATTARGFHAAVKAAVEDRDFVGDNNPTPILIRFEEHPNIAPLSDDFAAELTSLGFVREPAPVPSIPSTREDSQDYVRAWSYWLGDAPDRSAPYYGQTTDVTCGAVTALMNFEASGVSQFGDDGDTNQAREIEFWRSATNMPACEPVGLAVSTAKEKIGAGLPKVVLSAPDLVLLEWFENDPGEHRLRTQLQRDALRTAEKLNIEVDRRWISVEEIRDQIDAGNDVYLLITLEPLIGDPTPHWILAHDVIGDSIIVSDPWVESDHGESWADTSNLPIPMAGIDLITRWGDPEYRGVIIIPHA